MGEGSEKERSIEARQAQHPPREERLVIQGPHPLLPCFGAKAGNGGESVGPNITLAWSTLGISQPLLARDFWSLLPHHHSEPLETGPLMQRPQCFSVPPLGHT